MTKITIKGIREKFRQKKKGQVKETEKKKRTESEEERVDFVGFVLSKKFKYYKLMLAAKTETAEIEGREVDGYMQRMFSDYDWLIENEVLDRACYFALQDYQPIVHNFVNNYDFPNMHRSLVTLPERKAHWKLFPLLEFEEMVVYSEEPLEKDLTWINNYKWKTEDGYDTTITFGQCNFLNMGSPLHDLPVLVIKDALGKSNLFFQAKTTAEDLTKEKNELIRREIFKLRDEGKNIEDQLEESKMEAKGHKRRYDNLKYTMLNAAPYMEKEDFERYERREAKRSQFDKTNYKRIAQGIIILLFVIIIIIGCIFLFAPRPTSTEIPEGAGLLTSHIFKRGI